MDKNINDVSFFDEFSVHDMTVGLVGFGYIGKAVEHFFNNKCKTLIYDKYPSDGLMLDTLEDVVRYSHLIFVAVPTPMNKDGSCNTSILASVFDDIKDTAERVQRDLNDFVVISKCTVPPGFTDSKRKETGLRLVYSPEFLTEKNSINDFQNSNRMLFGGEEKDCEVARQFFMKGLHNDAVLVVCDKAKTLEAVKLFTNGILATKVMFGNEMYKLCEKLGLEYEEVMLLSCLDNRIGRSHLTVPGHDGDFGYGGHCFVKDLNSLRYVSKELGTGEKLFSAVVERNNEIRKDRDWERMPGRAVIAEQDED